MVKTNSIEAYSVTLLYCNGNYLLLRRSPSKQFAPGRWTGLGGHVEPDEYSDLQASALREVEEESKFLREEIFNFTLRRVLLVNRQLQPLRVLLYFTGIVKRLAVPECPEGHLAWVRYAEFDELDIIETTRSVLACLINDIGDDPSGKREPRIGMTVFDATGQFQKIVWA